MNLFEMAKIPLNKAIEVMKLDPSAADIIATPERTLEVSIPVRMDDGTTKVFTGYRSTAPLWGRLKAAFVIIPESTWTK